MLVGWQVFVSGAVLGLTIAAPPGPVNLAAASRATGSWSSVWFVLAGATTADGVFFLLTYYDLTALIASEEAKDVLFLVGGGLMLYFAFLTLRSARGPLEGRAQTGGRYPYVVGFAIGITSPFQLAWWLTVGIGMVSTFGFSIILGFFSGIIAWTLIFPCWCTPASPDTGQPTRRSCMPPE